MLLLQLMIAAGGGLALLVKRIPIGASYEISRPWTVFLGLALVCQAPLALMLGGAAVGIEKQKAAKIGERQVSARKVQQRWGWLDEAVTGTAVGLAALLGFVGLRRPPIEDEPYEPPVGVRDYVFESKLQLLHNPDPEDRDRAAPVPVPPG